MQYVLKFSKFMTNMMAVWVILFTVIALIYPNLFIWIAPYITILLGVIMFTMGLTLSIDDFKEIFKQPIKVIVLALSQYLVMPIIAVSLVFLFNLPPEIAIGVILVGSSPGGTSSNVMTFLAKGNVALSVAATTVTTLLAPIVTPSLTLLLASTWLDISFSAMMVSILQVVLIPVLLGLGVGSLFRKQVDRVVDVLPMISMTWILGVMTAVTASNVDNILASGLIILLVVILHNSLGYVTGFLLGKIFKFNLADTKTISIEVGMQNSGLATTLAVQHFEPVTALPGALFSVWHSLSGAVLANVFGKIKEKDSDTMNQKFNQEVHV
ncbi:bile acid:sodium symporter family protein [Nosocomiicoccus ampullae]|uniref:BASS family bile acid:Na+ symporter n=1 Tax=Nosocomiicoccus ampullae TaxID=489910 RepID=A0A9Q2CZE3_9STAP|nr:bile acid:sodium symporter family protein [Nosocomiicoccus ampullae]MBB5176120.1 BASS family bile acid:Na+ symporter [Nosocomiicoccus ampullae]QYA47293.1 bile acid:sodium symporter family protein [Nosocomiicoccus ampullae]